MPERQLTAIGALLQSGMLSLDAAVPGNFELDMMAAGLIGDLYVGKNILQARKLEDRHLFYYRRFSYTPVPGTEPVLILEGVDTVADVYVNGLPVGHTDNMLIPHEMPLHALKAGENELVIHIRPTLLEAMKEPASFGEISLEYTAPSLHIRKPGHCFGWDIAPRLLSGGLWRPVRLEYRPRSHIAEIYLATSRIDSTEKTADLVLFYQLNVEEGVDPLELCLHVQGRCAESVFDVTRPLWFSSGKFYIAVTDARLWWPKNRGEPRLYDVTVTLLRGDEALDTRVFHAGIRTVELQREHGEIGAECFRFLVNGEPVFITGTNWVPADALHSRDAERMDAMLDLAEDLGCNMLRCWGGNVYESDAFFDRCDEAGILVWQDFAMACGTYPQDAAMQEKLRLEAVSVVKRLRQHPSLCLWAGDNECDTAYVQHAPPRDPGGNVLTRGVLPEVLRSHDGMRPYLPSSPYIDEVDYRRGNTFFMEDHLWGSRRYYKGEEYDGSSAAFASEIGYHGCPSPDSLRRFLPPECQWPPDDTVWLLHGSSPEPSKDACFGYRVDLMFEQVRLLFGREMDSLEEFALASQISQAEALKHFIELFRLQKGRRWGILWWNLIDCWPQFSDAVVDYYFTKKLAYSMIRTAQLPIAILFAESRQGCIRVTAINDTRHGTALSYTVWQVEERRKIELLDGRRDVPPDGQRVLGEIPQQKGAAFYLVEWNCRGKRFQNHYVSGRPPFSLEWLSGRLAQCGLLRLEGFSKSELGQKLTGRDNHAHNTGL